VLAVSVLAGCSVGGQLGAGDDGPRASPAIQIMSKSFTVAGPRGFCIDPAATQETETGGFVILGSCAVISGNPNDAKPQQPAVLTASVAPATQPFDAAALDRMAAFFSSPDGLAALARSESATAATVLELKRDAGMLLIHARDGARNGDVAGDYWRAVFATAGQLVTVTVSGFRATPLDAKDGARLTRAFADAIRKANRSGATAATATAPRPSGGGLASFFNRLL